ncbi:hypothetical protein AX15_005241 [Amanita polypyramis BW_CC]|nr:hypothetical protein AX15_005241 [Amanita polypyramis BW_CC]
MRIPTTFLTLLQLASLSTVLAIHPHILSHRDHKHNATSTRTLARLQYHAPRALIDTCIYVDADAALKAAGDAPLLVSALTGLCICLKDLDIQANPNLQLLASLLGGNTVLRILTDIACGASSLPRLFKKEPIITLVQAKATCRAGEEIVVSFYISFLQSTEANESGGGCMSAHPFTEKPESLGKDCSRLPNALEVECVKRTCVVHRCKDGFKPSESQDTCVRNERARMKKYRKRGDSASTNTVVYADSNLLDQLAILVNTAVKLRQDYYLLSWSDDAIAYERRFTWSTVYPILQSLANVLTSPEIASLVTNTNALLDAVLASSKGLGKCNCIDSLGLHDLVADLDTLLVSTVDLSQWLMSNSPKDANTDDSANILNLSGLLDKLGLGNILSNVTIDGLGTGLDVLVNSLLGIGPNGVARRTADLNTNLKVNLDALLDSVLRLVLDTNTVMNTALPSKNLTTMVLQESVGDVIRATAALVEAIAHGQPMTLELSTLVNSSERALNVLGPSQLSSQVTPIILDLDRIIGLLSATDGPSSPLHYDNEPSNLGVKGLEIDAAATGLGLDTNLGLSLNSLLTGLGL